MKSPLPTCLFGLALGFALFTSASTASAAPSISIGMDPTLPGHVENPGGLFVAWCDVDTDGTTPMTLQIRLFDGNGVEVMFLDYPESTEYYLYWYVPAGLDDGLYQYQVDYISVEGSNATARGPFLVAGATAGFCAFKFIDTNGDGIYDSNTESLAAGWEVCLDGPLDGCKFTDASGAACWFFIPSGTYEACETLQPGYSPTTPACETVEVLNSIEKVLFGNMLTPPSEGACCFPPCDCVILTEEDCVAQGGVYQGDDTVCEPNPCPCPPEYGACCFPPCDCVILTEADCLAQGGVYQGDDTLCEPNPCPCPPSTGACCVPGIPCFVTTEEECLGMGGLYQGDDVPCSPDPCIVVPTEESSWGRVKVKYR